MSDCTFLEQEMKQRGKSTASKVIKIYDVIHQLLLFRCIDVLLYCYKHGILCLNASGVNEPLRCKALEKPVRD